MSKEAMKLALEIAIDYMNDRLEDHDCKYQRHPATEAERINILADIETVKEALAKQEQSLELVEWRDVDGTGIPEPVYRLEAKQEQCEPVANVSTWFALVMNAAAELENASIFLRDEDAKRVAISGAKYYRDQANTLYTTPQPKQEHGEPVAWCRYEEGMLVYYETKAWDDLQPLYTTPQQRKPLTDEQIDKAMAENKQTLIDAADNYWKMRRAYARIIEAAHGIKE